MRSQPHSQTLITANPRFPQMRNGLPHGSTGAGIQYLGKLMYEVHALAEPTQEQISYLLTLYESLIAYDLSEPSGKPPLARSDENSSASSSSSSSSTANKHPKRIRLVNEIYQKERLLAITLEDAKKLIEMEGLNKSYIEALAEVGQYVYHTRMGDYLAIYTAELKAHASLHEFEFTKLANVEEMICKYKEEEQKLLPGSKDATGTRATTPVTDSIIAASKFLSGSLSRSPSAERQIMDVLEGYANREKTAFHHGATKTFYDEGNFPGLHIQLVEDRRALDGLPFSAVQKKKYIGILDVVQRLFYRVFSWEVARHHELNVRGGAVLLRRKREPVEIDIYGEARVGEVGYQRTPPEEIGGEGKAAARAREKSLAEEAKEIEIFNIRQDFSEAAQLVDKIMEKSEGGGGDEDEGSRLKVLLAGLSSASELMQRKLVLRDQELVRERRIGREARRHAWKLKERLGWADERIDRLQDEILEARDGLVEEEREVG